MIKINIGKSLYKVFEITIIFLLDLVPIFSCSKKKLATRKGKQKHMKLFKCNMCGKIVCVINDTDTDIICCGAPMTEIIPQTKDAINNKEKHVPTYKLDGNKVTVYIGETPHPSEPTHYIEWIAIKTNMGKQRKCLKPGDAPKATFYLAKNERIEEIYAYCNIHSLWKYCEEKQEDCNLNKKSCCSK